MSAQEGPGIATPADPEHDPLASYAVDPGLARRLSARVVSTSGETHTTYAPFTTQPAAVVALSTPEDVAEAARRAAAAQRDWAAVPLELRAHVLLRFHDLVLDRQDDILDLVQWESGKARKHAFEEVGHLAMTARYYGRLAERLLAPRRIRGLFPLLTRVDLRRPPKGVVGIISPWNYPFTMAVCDGLPALLAGNTVVHKPDLQTPLSALMGIDLLREAGMPPEAWQVVYGDGPTVGSAVIDNVDHICFTGSTRTGRYVAGRAAERVIGTSLELGGKNPMLVLRDADIDRAAEGAARACFSSAGQLCVSMERLYVADQIYDQFIERFVGRAEAMRLGRELDYTADMGSLVSVAQLDKVERHVADARSQGAEVVTGGHRRDDVGPLFYAPTVLTGVRPGMLCFEEETFGPVVSVYRFADEADAIARANEGEFGLNACVYTRDRVRGRAIAARIRCGTVNVNEAYGATFGSIEAPMGGMRRSGIGRRQGPDGLYRFTEPQAIATQRVMPIAPAFGLTDAAWARSMTVALRVLKKLHRA
jgi:succinate-semialdehyde dehydrogenase/glutarate-semialdehyde dehydrogenase